MIPQKKPLTESGKSDIPAYIPYVQRQQGIPHPVTNIFQQHAHQMGYMPPVAPMQTVPVWQTPIIGYRTEMFEGMGGFFFPKNVPIYGTLQIVHMPNFYQPEDDYGDDYYEEELTDEISKVDNQETDLNLSQDIVGHAVETVTNSVALNSLTATSPEVDTFFAPQETVSVKKPAARKQKSPGQLLRQFVKAAQSSTMTVDRDDYQQMISAYQQDRTNPAKWEAAMLHDIPPGLLKNLKNILYFVKPREKESRKGRTTFLFPCNITCTGNMTSKTVNENKDKMCLELTLLKNGKPVHMFLRPLRSR